MCEKATKVGPSDANVLALFGNILIDLGRVKEGIQKLQKAIRLSPFPPAWYLSILGAGYHLIDDNENAIPLLEQAAEREPESVLSRLWLASALAETGRLEEGRYISREILDLEPTFSIGRWMKSFKVPPHEKLRDNLINTGLPI